MPSVAAARKPLEWGILIQEIGMTHRLPTCSDAEWQARVDLAACYRLHALNGWTDLIYTHISARVPGSPNHFLLNPFGLMFDEVTASNLVKIDIDRQVVEPTPHAIHRAGFVIHSAVHQGRADAHCVIHAHTRAGMAVSTMATSKCSPPWRRSSERLTA